jgi:hypothetical protein
MSPLFSAFANNNTSPESPAGGIPKVYYAIALAGGFTGTLLTMLLIFLIRNFPFSIILRRTPPWILFRQRRWDEPDERDNHRRRPQREFELSDMH